MIEPHFTLSPPKWEEADAVSAREFFSNPNAVGQRMLQMIRHRRPVVLAPDADNRRTEHEILQGYERCFREIFRLLEPKS